MVRFLVLGSVLLAVIGLPLSARATSYLVILLDDVGTDKVGAYAGDTYGASTADDLPDTPNLDALAGVGLRFTNAWTNPVCSPSRASLLTGRYPFQHDVGVLVAAGTPSLSTAESTLPEVLSDAAYTAAALPSGVFGKWHLGEWSTGGTTWSVSGTYADVPNPGEHGFVAFAGTLLGAVETYRSWTRVDWPVGGAAEVATSTTWAPDAAVDDAVRWISGQSGDWMTVVVLQAAHTDEDGTKGRYEGDDLPPFTSCPDVDGDGACSSDEVYLGLVEAADDRVGLLLSDLAAVDPALLEDTVVVVMGDNGTPRNVIDPRLLPSGERAEAGKNSAYESGVRVPLLLTRGCDWMDQSDGAYDGWYSDGSAACAGSAISLASPGLAVSAPVQVMDLYATITELAGSTFPSPSSSISLTPCLSATTASAADCGSAALAGRMQYAETFFRPYTPGSNFGTTGLASSGELAAKAGDFKVVGRIQGSPLRQCMRWELYDLSTDPYETDDLRGGGSVMDGLQTSQYRALRYFISHELAPDWIPSTTCRG